MSNPPAHIIKAIQNLITPLTAPFNALVAMPAAPLTKAETPEPADVYFWKVIGYDKNSDT
ncbi:hypothetical protein BZ04_27820 [Escherichia coli O111:NM str. K6908]|nr:hypothetical protein BZ04_27820 [Escherichia coli O111:NM str. K6908]